MFGSGGWDTCIAKGASYKTAFFELGMWAALFFDKRLTVSNKRIQASVPPTYIILHLLSYDLRLDLLSITGVVLSIICFEITCTFHERGSRMPSRQWHRSNDERQLMHPDSGGMWSTNWRRIALHNKLTSRLVLRLLDTSRCASKDQQFMTIAVDNSRGFGKRARIGIIWLTRYIASWMAPQVAQAWIWRPPLPTQPCSQRTRFSKCLTIKRPGRRLAIGVQELSQGASQRGSRL